MRTRAREIDGPSVRLRVLLLGPMVVELDGSELHVAGPQRRRLLALLACRAGRVVPVDALVDAMWGEDPPASAAKTVQSHMVRLRQSLAGGGNAIETTAGGYRLDIDPADTDAARFDKLASEGAGELRMGHFAAAIKLLEAALALWRGPALMEFSGDDFAVGDRTRLDERRLIALEDLAEARLGAGGASTVVPDMERVVADEPGRERAWGLLMQALYASGRQHDALEAYQRARAVLSEEFGLDPGRELRDLEKRIIDHDPTLLGARNRGAIPIALRHETPIAGREYELAWLQAAWRRTCAGVGQVRAVIGKGGSGRTRLLAEMADTVVADGGSVEYVAGSSGLHLLGDGSGPGAVIDAVGGRARRAPVMLVVDDVDWTPTASMDSIRALATAAERFTLFLVMIGSDREAPGVQLVRELERTCATTLELGPMSDHDLAEMLTAHGVEVEAQDAAIAMAGGIPAVARREAAAWAERAATDRLNAAATLSVDARSAAATAGATVLDEVLRLVDARSRRAELTGAEWMGRQPYRSLASYEAADADLFVGRERLVAELTARVLDRRLVAVVGASGSGKSSIVRAGLMPLVRSGRLPGEGAWRAHVIVPGVDPIRAIDAVPALDEPGPQLLVIDQFEEILGTDQIDAVAGKLLDLVLDPALDAHIVLAIRADQIAGLAASRTLAQVIEEAEVLVGPPTDEELRRIVVEPAQRTGCTVEPALVARISADVAGHDAALPLVSAAMAEVWERRDGDVLRVESYEAIGGLAAAVERLGDRALAAVGREGESSVRDVMLRLVDVTDEGAWVRRRVPSDDMPTAARVAIDALLDARLIVHTGDSLDVVHEVVFRAWPQMVSWLEEARVDITLERDLRATARTWDANGRSDDDVLRGGRLHLAADWASRSDHVAPLIAELIAASRDWVERDNIAIRQQLERERRSKRRFRGALVAASLLLVLALVGGMLAYANSRRAKDAESAALDQRNQARIDRLVAESGRVVEGQLDLAYLLAVEARRRQDTPATRGALLTTLVSTMPTSPTRSPLARFSGYMNSPRFDPAPPVGNRTDLVGLSGDGSVLAVVGQYSVAYAQLVVSDVKTRAVLGHVDMSNTAGGPAPVIPSAAQSVDVSDDGRTVIVLNALLSFEPNSAGLTVFDVPSGSARSIHLGTTALPPDSPGVYIRALLTPDGQHAVVLLPDATATVWDLKNDTAATSVPGGPYQFIDVLPDGTFAGITFDGRANFVDLTTGASIGSTQLHSPDDDFLLDASFAFSPDRSRIFGAHFQGATSIWDATTGEIIGDPDNRPTNVRWVTTVPTDPNLVAIGTFDGNVVLWDVIRDVEVSHTKVHGSGVRDMAISANGRTMAVTADDKLVSLWGDVGGPAPIQQRVNSPGLELFPLATVMASPDRHLIAVVGGGIHEIRQASDPDTPGIVLHDPAPHTVWAFDRDGTRLLAQEDMHSSALVVYDTATGDPIWTQPDFDPDAQTWGWSTLSPDGSLVAFEQNPFIRVWNVDENREVGSVDLQSLELFGGTVTQLMFTDDGKYLDVPTTDGPARLSVPELQLVEYVPAARPQIKAVRLPDGDIDAMNGPGRVSRFDMETGDVLATGRGQDMTTIGALALSPDGTVVAGNRGAVHGVSLFDAETAQPIGPPIPAGATGEVVFADDEFRIGLGGTHLIDDGLDGVLTAYNIDPDDWQALACHAAGRNLTHDEWNQYLGADQPYRATCPEWPAAAE